MKHLFALLLLAGLAGPVMAETLTIQEALSGKPLPHPIEPWLVFHVRLLAGYG